MSPARCRFALAALLGLASITGAPPASADFNPFGRKGKRPAAAGSQPTTKPAAATRPPAGEKPGASSASSAKKPPAEEAPNGGAAAAHPGPDSDKPDVLIARYTALVLSRPGEPFPLERLVELYRSRDGNLDRLVAEFTARARKAGPEHYAAQIALAGVLRHDAQTPAAIVAYEQAIAEAPKNPVAILALGRLLEAQGDKAGARARYEESLPLVTTDADREQLLHTLVGLCLDLRDYDAAKRYHAEIVQRAKGSFFARAELGRELMTRGEYARAEAEYRELVKTLAGDNRVLGPALRDLGQALAREGKPTEAIEVLRRALTVAAGQSGLRRDVLDVMVEVYRAHGGVGELVSILEKEHPDDFERLSLLAALYEETGRVADALATYRRALARKDDIATRLKVVQLLQVQGKLDEAVTEYQKLIALSPHDPQLVFRLVETLIQRGDRKQALAELTRLEARAAGDDETLTALVDFYERIDETERATRLLDRLAKSGGGDPRHLVDLGDHYYRQGDTKRAVEVWERIRVVVPDRAKALHTLGEVFLEHDMPDDALALLKQAADLAPRDGKYQKALALALERTGTAASGSVRAEQHEAARKIWEKLLRESGSDKAVAREARQHIVTLWDLDKHLLDYVRPLERRLAQSPPDLEAGRLLAEVYARLRRPADAERTLQTIVARAPGDEESYLGLERALVAQHKLDAAIATLDKLVKLDARRAREYYQRMAQYAAELYRDDDAIRYASKAVELSPDDAAGHQKLGDMYRRRQDVEHAVSELRLAIAKNDRLFPVYFDLAELLLTRGELDEADRLLRHVVRAAPDDDLVARAARLSMQVNLGRGTLDSLERELLPVALGNPGRPIYRRLLVEVYGNMAFTLMHEARGADPARAAKAKEALRQMGEHAVKPLLDALSDDRDSQQRTAVELLSYISNANAAPALLAFATGKADGELRTRAMIAVGALADPSILPRLKEVIAPQGNVRVDESDTVAIAAAWAVARLRSPRARPLLTEMLASDAPSVRALAAIGLGLLGNRESAHALSAIAAAPDQEPIARAAAAFALGALGGETAEDVLGRLVEAPDPALRGAAVIGLAAVRAKSAKRVIAAGLVSADPSLRDAAASAALVVVTGRSMPEGDPLPLPEGRVDVRAVLTSLRPAGFTPDESARAVVELAPDLETAAVTAARSGPEGARAVADAVLSRGGRPAFAPLTDHLDAASPEQRARCEASLEGIGRALVEPFLALSRHPAEDVRLRAIRVLALRPEPDARAAVVAALHDTDPLVQRGALVALAGSDDGSALDALSALAEKADVWASRSKATEALAALVKGPRAAAAVAVLSRVAERDPIAFVRETAVKGLGVARAPEARAALLRISERDPEPRVRALARTLLGQKS
ncbi:MAG TPA: tetratricopeptide repeat protein [Polyangiaceae bacterium]|nr:tetratricopeptide repeat protein [Polyangiaceae bacterium]